MYKETLHSTDYRNRTGSEATKSSARGRIDDLPSWAQEPEDYFNNLKDRYEILAKQLHDLRERVRYLKIQLKSRPPFEEAKRLHGRLDVDGPALAALEREAADYRSLTRSAAVNAYGCVYYYCALKILDKEMRMRIETEVKQFLTRPPTDGIEKPRSERMDADARHRENVKGSKRNQLNKMRDGRGERKILRWSDEGGGIVK